MDDRKQQYLDIINQKLDALHKMLEATKRLEISGEGEEDVLELEAERFSSLYEQRAEIFKRIEKMDEELAELKDLESPETDEADEFVRTRKLIVDKIREMAKELAALDKEHIEASKKITAYLRTNLKQIRDGRDVSNAYTTDTHESSSGYYFDRTN